MGATMMTLILLLLSLRRLEDIQALMSQRQLRMIGADIDLGAELGVIGVGVEV